MEIVKKNIVSILCGVVAILAVAALFYPIGGMYQQETATLNERKGVYDDVSRIRTASRSLPIVDVLSDNPQQAKLDRFPSEPVIDEGNKVKDRVAQQAAEMLKATIAANRRAPLLSNVFPSPGNLRYSFGDLYQQRVKELANVLNSVTPPNTQEIQAESERIWKSEFEPKIIKVQGQEVNRDTVAQEFAQYQLKLPEKLRAERAAKYKMYLDPGALPVSSAFGPGRQPKDEEVWYAQTMLWVEEDVSDAIKRMNQRSKSVLTSPVKQLIKLEIPEDAQMYLNTLAQGGAAPTPDGGAPTQPPEELQGKAWKQSPTGRVSNPLYDVVRYAIQMNVDATQLPLIITELQKGKLITVFQTDTVSVDAKAAIDQGYVYGPAPIVTATLHCEELFMRDWTTPLMPKEVKQALFIPVPDSGTPAPQ